MVRFSAVEEISLCNGYCKANWTEYELQSATNIWQTTWLFAKWLIVSSNLEMQIGLQKRQI